MSRKIPSKDLGSHQEGHSLSYPTTLNRTDYRVCSHELRHQLRVLFILSTNALRYELPTERSGVTSPKWELPEVIMLKCTGLLAHPASLLSEDMRKGGEERLPRSLSWPYQRQGNHAIMCESIQRGRPGISEPVSTFTPQVQPAPTLLLSCHWPFPM